MQSSLLIRSEPIKYFDHETNRSFSPNQKQSNETQEVTFMKFFRHVRMKLLNNIDIHTAVPHFFLFVHPKNENEEKVYGAKKWRILVDD